jgi:hypothetical protein
METNESPQLDALLLGEIQVLLSEKRTALSSMCTSIAVFALPLSVLMLIATSRYYSIGRNATAYAAAALNSGLVVLGSPVFPRSAAFTITTAASERPRNIGHRGFVNSVNKRTASSRSPACRPMFGSRNQN